MAGRSTHRWETSTTQAKVDGGASTRAPLGADRRVRSAAIAASVARRRRSAPRRTATTSRRAVPWPPRSPARSCSGRAARDPAAVPTARRSAGWRTRRRMQATAPAGQGVAAPTGAGRTNANRFAPCVVLIQQQRRDQIARQDEEHGHAEVAARQQRRHRAPDARVKHQHTEDLQTANTVERRPVANRRSVQCGSLS